MYIPPGTLRSRSFTRFTMRVGLPHFGQSVLLLVSMTFLRSAVFAIFAITLSRMILRTDFTNSENHWLDAGSNTRRPRRVRRGQREMHTSQAHAPSLGGFDCRRAHRAPLSFAG